MGTRVLQTAGRTFQIAISGTPNPIKNYSSYTVDHVFENGEEITIPGIEDNVGASSEDAALAHASTLIMRWMTKASAGTARSFRAPSPESLSRETQIRHKRGF